MAHVWNKRLMCPTFYSCYTHPLMPIRLYVSCLINVCSKRASRRASTTGRVCFKDVFGTLSEGLRPSVLRQGSGASKSYAVEPLRGSAVCADILHVLCAQIFFMCCVRIRLHRPNPIPTYNLNLFPSSLDMTYRMVTNFTLCPKKNE